MSGKSDDNRKKPSARAGAKAPAKRSTRRAPRPTTRKMTVSGTTVRIRGVRSPKYRDLYHTLLTISWTRFFLIALSGFLLINVLFALLYSLDPKGVTGMEADPGWNAFFFSVQTFGTIGYGVMAPNDHYANLVATFESFIGLGAVAVSTGVIFARVSRPTARVLFTQNAVVTLHEGAPTLIFRCANQRSNRILEAEITLNLARQTVTAEGLSFRKLEEMKVIRSRSPLFVLSWMVMHPIDESSPLFGATRESLVADQAEVVVVLAGEDETFAQRIHARHSYRAEDIVWNHRFQDIVTEDETGERLVDFTRFHSLEKAPRLL